MLLVALLKLSDLWQLMSFLEALVPVITCIFHSDQCNPLEQQRLSLPPSAAQHTAAGHSACNKWALYYSLASILRQQHMVLKCKVMHLPVVATSALHIPAPLFSKFCLALSSTAVADIALNLNAFGHYLDLVLTAPLLVQGPNEAQESAKNPAILQLDCMYGYLCNAFWAVLFGPGAA
jgi:hypothetical protein